MNQKKKKLLAPAPEPQLDILATPRNRRLFLGAVIVIYGMGYAFSVWGKMHFGASLRRALVDSLTTMLLVIALQAPVWFWYRNRMKGATTRKN